jgi:hypothetical protein
LRELKLQKSQFKNKVTLRR